MWPIIMDLDMAEEASRLQAADCEGTGALSSDCSIDIHEDPAHIYIRAELPGFSKDGIQLDVSENTLFLEAQAEASEPAGGRRVARALALPAEVLEGRGDARWDDGVLLLVLDKRTKQAAQRIAVR
jgi:HSP20 family protein